MVFLLMKIYYDNKSDNTWTRFLSFFRYLFPTIDDLKTYIVSDEEKEYSTEIKYNLPNINRFSVQSTKKSLTIWQISF